MEGIKNRIITISGEPVSGKSTVVNKIKEKYEKQGYNVHVISTGQIFREVIREEYLKMYPDRTDANITDMQRDEEFARKRNKIDKMIDESIAKKGKEINSVERPNDVYIIDSRLAWKNIPDSFAIRLTVDDTIAGKRVFKDKTRGEVDSYDSLEEAIKQTKQRKVLEIERYKQRYGVDLTDEDHYDLIADTSHSKQDELADILINGEEAYRKGKYYPKYWASPTHFLPLQLGRTTGVPSYKGYTIESLAESIKENGYYADIDGLLEIVQNNGIKYLLEGNHRVFGALSAGKTLLPYEISHKEDRIARERTGLIESPRYSEYLYDYADGIRYYGGKIGKTDSLKNFELNDLLELDKFRQAQDRNGEDR